VLDGDRLDEQDGNEAGLTVQDPAGTGRAAYLAFTSGTTGAPRCVLGGHAAVAHYLDWSPEAFGLRADDRFSMISGLSHDPFLRDVFSPLSLGAQLFIPDVRTWARPEALAAWMREHRVTVAHLTPTMARRMVLPGRTSLPGLRRVLLGGESVRVADLRAFVQAAPMAEFTVVYGCTETPQVVMHHTATRDDLAGDPADPVPLGEPAPAAEVELVPRSGERAEIVIRSPHLAFGYLRRAGAGLRLEPFGSRYATGDLGRRDAAGRLVFAGRSDRQVKIHGVRVELDEVEHHLRSCPGVVWAAASVEPSSDEPFVRATVVMRPGAARTELEVRRYLVALLPAAAVPSVVTVLDQIPVSPNGKSGPVR
jgi:non-ribosomal peptide synthetase component F